jgi:hypothetical protein
MSVLVDVPTQIAVADDSPIVDCDSKLEMSSRVGVDYAGCFEATQGWGDSKQSCEDECGELHDVDGGSGLGSVICDLVLERKSRFNGFKTKSI